MIDDDFDSYINAYATKLADKAGYAWGLKGIPGEDKQHEEVEVASIVLQHLGIEAEIEPSEAPDNAVQIKSGKRLGIEVTELVDGKMRGLYAARRKAERDKGLLPQEAFDAENKAFRIAKNAAQMARENGGNWKDAFWSV